MQKGPTGDSGGFIIFWWTVPLTISLEVTTDINAFVSSTFLRHAGQLLLAHLPAPVVCAVTHAVHEHLNVSTPPPFCSLLYGPQSVTSQPCDGHNLHPANSLTASWAEATKQSNKRFSSEHSLHFTLVLFSSFSPKNTERREYFQEVNSVLWHLCRFTGAGVTLAHGPDESVWSSFATWLMLTEMLVNISSVAN